MTEKGSTESLHNRWEAYRHPTIQIQEYGEREGRYEQGDFGASPGIQHDRIGSFQSRNEMAGWGNRGASRDDQREAYNRIGRYGLDVRSEIEGGMGYGRSEAFRRSHGEWSYEIEGGNLLEDRFSETHGRNFRGQRNEPKRYGMQGKRVVDRTQLWERINTSENSHTNEGEHEVNRGGRWDGPPRRNDTLTGFHDREQEASSGSRWEGQPRRNNTLTGFHDREQEASSGSRWEGQPRRYDTLTGFHSREGSWWRDSDRGPRQRWKIYGYGVTNELFDTLFCNNHNSLETINCNEFISAH